MRMDVHSSKNRPHIKGDEINPFAVANIKELLAMAGIIANVELVDNLLEEGQEDLIAWYMPGYALEPANSDKEKRLIDLHDDDFNGEILKRFARIIPKVLRKPSKNGKKDGMVIIRNLDVRHPNAPNRNIVQEILETAGEDFDPNHPPPSPQNECARGSILRR